MNDSQWAERIRAEPQNKSLLLIYADWLEEQGDQRSENLRENGVCIQCVRRGVSVHTSAAMRNTAEKRESCALCAFEQLRGLFSAASNNMTDVMNEVLSVIQRLADA